MFSINAKYVGQSHNVERAVDWLFSHADSMMDDNVATNAAPSGMKCKTNKVSF